MKAATGSLTEAAKLALRQRLNVFRKFRPALEAMLPRNHELRVGQCEFRAADFIGRQIRETRMVSFDSLNCCGLRRLVGLLCSKDSDEFFRLFLVLLQARASRQPLGIHYDLPFVNAPGVRPNQAERRFVTLLEN